MNIFNKLKPSSLALCGVLLMSSCVANTTGSTNSADEDEITATEPAVTEVAEVVEEETDYGSFTEEQLYQAIISELGAQRGLLADAGESYIDLAFDTKDLTIIQRAIQFAAANEDTNALLQLGLLWAEVSPEDTQPHLMLSIQFLEEGAFDQALSHMARVIDLGGSMDFSTLSARTARMNPESRDGLISNLKQLGEQYPDQLSIRIALVQMLAQSGEYEQALSELAVFSERDELNPTLVLLEAQLLQNLERPEDAQRVLRDGIEEFEDDRNLRANYARLFIQQEDYQNARAQYQILFETDPQDWDALYSMALLDLEMENFDRAIVSFTQLINVDQQKDESQYYIAYSYDQMGDLQSAIENYRLVAVGTNNFLPAQNQATIFAIELGQLEDAHSWLDRASQGQPRLERIFNTMESAALIQAGYMDEAEQLLNSALNKYPNDVDLLFARVLYYDSVSNRVDSEADLRQIIRMQPEDSRALNHLGYMLADQTTRYEEALELIERAVVLSPEDPAIVDSLGWTQYKLGRYEEALANLRRAYADFRDDEVASHIGEVLWMMGRHDEALQVWQEALDEEPDSELIKEAMERLQAS
jgi:tetratricopeptide (TPR) repeat protein